METKQAMRKILAGEGGFTLIEIAIVMVIVGLLLGGVLKGQEMIENGRVRNAISSLDGVTAAYNSYFDRYRRIPGDDGPIATLTARGGNWANVTQAGNSNGVILSNAGDTFTGGNENDNFWQHLRAAGFVSGDPNLAGGASMPLNAFSGLTGITNDATIMTGPGTTGALAGNKVCLGRVPGKAAASIDAQLDDGVSNTGSIRATLGTAGTNTPPGAAVAPPYNEANEYTVCRTF